MKNPGLHCQLSALILAMPRFSSKKACARWASLLALLAGSLGAWLLCFPSKSKAPLASVLLSDGRVLQIEAVTYGTEHSVGTRARLLEHLGPWLPIKIQRILTPESPHFEVRTEKPALVVWVNALNADTGARVDCQGIRVEFVDEHHDLFGEETSYWSGRPNFWRVGHEFRAFPRSQSVLTLSITPWRSNQTVQVQFANPYVTPPAPWVGRTLPQQTNVGELEIVLRSLALRTNGGPKRKWETPASYWEPAWELKQQGIPLLDWEEPEWSAEDPMGNQSRFLGVHQPVLRFSAVFYPSATNQDTHVVSVLTNLPPFDLASLSSTNWSNIPTRFAGQDALVLGFLAAGTYTFSEGLPATDGPKTGPVSGGARSGWVGHSQRISPTQVKFWNSHYTPDPVIYVRAALPETKQRLAVRLKDRAGRYWPTEAEPQQTREGIKAFLVKEPPPDTSGLTAEIVVLTPVEAAFDVEIRRAVAPVSVPRL
jgi:hypothetical protein